MEPIRDEDAQGLSEGSRQALTRIHRALAGPLHAFLVRATDREAGKDLLQETWVRVMRAKRVPQRGSEVRPWIFRIAYHLVVDHWRARRPFGPLPETVASGGGEDPRRIVEERELMESIQAAVQSLPDPQRAVFLLREEGGIPFREIAEVLGIPQGTALARMHSALGRLRWILRRENVE